MVRRAGLYSPVRVHYLFKNILCYGSAVGLLLFRRHIFRFKNILCYGSAGGKKVFINDSLDLKTSYVMVRRNCGKCTQRF